MRGVLNIMGRLLLIATAVCAALFAVFYFDLDGKAMFYGLEPLLERYRGREKREMA